MANRYFIRGFRSYLDFWQHSSFRRALSICDIADQFGNDRESLDLSQIFIHMRFNYEPLSLCIAVIKCSHKEKENKLSVENDSFANFFMIQCLIYQQHDLVIRLHSNMKYMISFVVLLMNNIRDRHIYNNQLHYLIDVYDEFHLI